MKKLGECQTAWRQLYQPTQQRSSSRASPTYTCTAKGLFPLPSYVSTLMYKYGMSEVALPSGDSTDFTEDTSK